MTRHDRRLTGCQSGTLLVVVAGMLTACAGSCSPSPAPPQAAQAAGQTPGPSPSSESPLAGTDWRLVEMQSMDDAIGTTRPADPSQYSMRLDADGTVTMHLNCNVATGSWQSEAGPERSSGRFQFGPLAMTRALCPPPSLDEQIAAQAEYVRSYLLRDDRLYLSLMADGGIYVWEPAGAEAPRDTPD